MRKPKQTNSIFWEVVLDALFQKKIAETKKLQNTGVKQQFAWTNKTVDDLIIRLENFKTLMEFEVFRRRQKHIITGITGKTMSNT